MMTVNVKSALYGMQPIVQSYFQDVGAFERGAAAR